MASRRGWMGAAFGGRSALWAALAAVAAVVLMSAPSTLRADTGPVPTENAQPGTPGWWAPTAPQPTRADQWAGRVESIDGWVWPLSAAPGEDLDLHVGTASGVRYRVEFYRLGWYSGAGARLMACLPSCGADKAGIVQPLPPAPDPVTGEVSPDWSLTDEFTVPASWPSGFYIAALKVTAGNGTGSVRRLPFVVRAPASQTSRVVVIVPVNTWQAYNGWGGNALYDNHSADGVRASHVSFERPWMEGVEQSTWRYDEMNLVRFLERKAVDVSYITDSDVSSDPGILDGHNVVMTSGHDEYWTKEHFDALEAARDAGQNLAFMGANIGYWQVRYANGGRTMVGYKSLADPIADPALKTARFRDTGRPECTLLGVQYMASSWPLGDSADLGVVDASLSDPWFAGTGFTPGATITDGLGYEWDQIVPGCATQPLTRLFQWQSPGWPVADSVRYTAPSGAKVFSAATLQFSWGLDGWRYNSASAAADPRLEAFTVNMLTDMGGIGSGSTEPAVTVTPATATVTTGGTRQFSAALENASDGVEWSVDGIAGGDAAVGTVSASGLYTAPATVPAGGTVIVRATHVASGASDEATVTVTGPAAPQITTQPAAQSVTAGGTATFTAAASGSPVPTVQWQVSEDAGVTFTDIAGATSPTLTLTGVTISKNQSRYRAVFTNTEGGATSAAAILTVTATGGAPANDAFAAAQVITGNTGTVTGSNLGATKEAGEPTQAGNAGGASIWYSWTPAANGNVTFDTAGSSFDTTLGISTGTAVNALTLRTSNDDVSSGVLTSRATLTVTAGTTYRISVDGYNALKGAVTLNWNLTVAVGPPANDAFAAAQVLAGNTGTITGTNLAATKESGEPSHAGNAGGGSVWYSWTPTSSGSATIDTAGSAFDTTLAVYTGTAVNALTARASNDDVSSGVLSSRVTLTVTAGTTYRIAVDGYGAARGAITLNWAGSTTTTAPQITTQPAAQSVTAGGTATFTAAASGSPTPTVQWQVSSDGGTSFSDLTGATAPTLTLSAVTVTQDQNRYRAVFTNTVSTATSAAAILTVTPPATAPQITTQPAAQSVTAGGTATFTAVASGSPAPTVQWQVSTDGGSSFANLPAATSPTLTLSAVTLAQNQNRYRAVFTNSADSATTTAAILTVTAATAAPQITTQPAAQSVTAGGTATFTAAASGSPVPTVQWQVSEDAGVTFTDIAGATSPTLTLTGVTISKNQSRYRAVFTNTEGGATSAAAILTVTATGGAPANDAFAAAQVITGNTGTVTGSNLGATKEAGEPTQAGNAGGASIWYSWTPAANGNVTFDTAGSSFDTTLGISTGTAVNALTLRTSNDDVSSGVLTSRATLTVTAGTTYRISVDGYNALKGAVTLNWNLTVAVGPPANDAFAAAQVLAGNTGTITGTNLAATKESGEPSHAGNAGGGSVWYSWTPTSSGSATIDTAGSAFDTTLAVYTGTAVNALTARASNDDVSSGVLSSRVTLTVTAGTTYRIAVDGYNTVRGAITLNWVR